MTLSYNVPFVDYLALPGVHFSTLKHMQISPLHYRRAVDHERADTPALRLGRLAHAMILTPHLPADVALWEGSTKRGKAWTQFEADADDAGKIIVRPEELYAAERMRAAVLANPVARGLLRDGDGEVTATWDEDVPHVYAPLSCRARFDWLGGAGLVELKTTRVTTPRAWAREVAARSYHVQLAHYDAGLVAVTGVHVPVWWIVVERNEPFDVAVYRVRDADLETGQRVRTGWLQRVAECEASGRWPGVGGDAPIEFALPDYAATEGLEDVDLDGIGVGASDNG